MVFRDQDWFGLGIRVNGRAREGPEFGEGDILAFASGVMGIIWMRKFMGGLDGIWDGT